VDVQYVLFDSLAGGEQLAGGKGRAEGESGQEGDEEGLEVHGGEF
jgi:hypothetical protein